MEELFALLICKGSVSRDEVADMLWIGFTIYRAMKNLNFTVYYIGKALQQYYLEDCMITARRQISLKEDTDYVYHYDEQYWAQMIKKEFDSGQTMHL